MRRRIASGAELERLRRTIDDLFVLLCSDADGQPRGWSPAVDLLRFPDRFVVRLDLAGVAHNELEIQLRNRQLTISGRRGPAQAPGVRHYHRMERGGGAFAVEVLIPDLVDPGRCRASLRGGVLDISLPLLYGRPDVVHTIEIEEEGR
jgi:HSP20 family molecular chaperone IbpA